MEARAFTHPVEVASVSGTTAILAQSDVHFDPDRYKSNGNVYVEFIAHLSIVAADANSFAELYRQNAGTAVSGTRVTTPTTDTDSGTGDEGYYTLRSEWVDISADSGFESYQIRMGVGGNNASNATAEINSAVTMISPTQSYL